MQPILVSNEAHRLGAICKNKHWSSGGPHWTSKIGCIQFLSAGAKKYVFFYAQSL